MSPGIVATRFLATQLTPLQHQDQTALYHEDQASVRQFVHKSTVLSVLHASARAQQPNPVQNSNFAWSARNTE